MQKKDLIEPSSQLIASVKALRQRYSAYLDEQKKLEDKSKKNDQIEMLNAKLQNVLSKKKRLLKVCKNLDDEFVELVKKKLKRRMTVCIIYVSHVDFYNIVAVKMSCRKDRSVELLSPTCCCFCVSASFSRLEDLTCTNNAKYDVQNVIRYV